MTRGLVSTSSININRPVNKVWQALTKPEIIKQYMFGTDVESGWTVGSSIFWRGEWQGKKYEDKGKILKFEENRSLQYSHFSPMAGKPDIPENYHTVTIELSGNGAQTSVELLQDGNETEEAKQHSKNNWDMMLTELKKLLEK